MIILANDEKAKNVLFINDMFLKLPLLNKNLNLEKLLFPDKTVKALFSDVEALYTLIEINMGVYNRVPEPAPYGYDLDGLSEEQKILLNDKLVERPLHDEINQWLTGANEFYVKSSDSDVIVCVSTEDTALSHGFVKMQSTNIKEVILELFYSQFTYFDIHNLSRPNIPGSGFEITVAKAFELGLN